MPERTLCCFRCGSSLVALSLPLSQRDTCPDCMVFLHACRMCCHYDAGVAKKCREDDAEEVTDKENMNFCEWFTPNPDAFDPQRAAAARKAENRLQALFGDGADVDSPDAAASAAEDLFK